MKKMIQSSHTVEIIKIMQNGKQADPLIKPTSCCKAHLKKTTLVEETHWPNIDEKQTVNGVEEDKLSWITLHPETPCKKKSFRD